jgi:hypothetical protein
MEEIDVREERCVQVAVPIGGKQRCRATIKVRKPDNQDEKVVALLVSKGGRSPTEGASSATISLSFFEGRRVR